MRVIFKPWRMARNCTSAAAVLSLILLTMGCSQNGTSPVTVAVPEGVTQEADQRIVPNYSGAYAEHFRAHYLQSKSQRVQEILADERISDSEADEVLNSFELCLADAKIELEYYDERGVSLQGDPATSSSTDVQAAAEQCSLETEEHLVLSLYFVIRADPDLSVTPESVVICLKKKGVVGGKFSEGDYVNGELERLVKESKEPGPRQRMLESIEQCTNDPVW